MPCKRAQLKSPGCDLQFQAAVAGAAVDFILKNATHVTTVSKSREALFASVKCVLFELSNWESIQK
jgi:hypothetical protein